MILNDFLGEAPQVYLGVSHRVPLGNSKSFPQQLNLPIHLLCLWAGANVSAFCIQSIAFGSGVGIWLSV